MSVRKNTSPVVFVISVLLVTLTGVAVYIASAQQTASDDRLTGNWAVRNVGTTDGVTRSTYFNLKYEGGKITGAIRTTQFFYTIKELSLIHI